MNFNEVMDRSRAEVAKTTSAAAEATGRLVSDRLLAVVAFMVKGKHEQGLHETLRSTLENAFLAGYLYAKQKQFYEQPEQQVNELRAAIRKVEGIRDVWQMANGDVASVRAWAANSIISELAAGLPENQRTEAGHEHGRGAGAGAGPSGGTKGTIPRA